MGVQAAIGGSVVWHCDVDPGASKILAHHWPNVPNLGDITRVDWASVKPVHVLTGGFPCTDVSLCGGRAGLHDGTRSGLWAYMAEAIDQLRPDLVVIENVRGLLSASAGRGDAADPPGDPIADYLTGADDAEASTDLPGDDVGLDDEDLGDDAGRPVLLRALGAVLGDLADRGYDAAWCGMRAADVGAPHGRFRVFVIAWPAQDADGATRGERGIPAPRQAEGGRAWTDTGGRGGASSADAHGDAVREQPVALAGCGGEAVAGLAGAETPADANVRGCERVGRVDTLGRDAHGRGGADVAWGDYEPAVRRWEAVLGRPAPAPTEQDWAAWRARFNRRRADRRPVGMRGPIPPPPSPRLSPRFVEFLMGLPEGHVTGVSGLSRNDQLKALGNGVVWQQAAEAIRRLLGAAGEVAA